MKKIYKYPLKLGLNELEIPYIEILNVINQRRVPTLYVLVNMEQQKKGKIKIYVSGTGWNIDDSIIENTNYLNTITDGMFVWHIFYQEIS